MGARNLLYLAKDSGHRYVFLYDDEPQTHYALQRLFGRLAATAGLDFDWSDAACLGRIAEARLRERPAE